jgi:hypothetical protein
MYCLVFDFAPSHRSKYLQLPLALKVSLQLQRTWRDAIATAFTILELEGATTRKTADLVCKQKRRSTCTPWDTQYPAMLPVPTFVLRVD